MASTLLRSFIGAVLALALVLGASALLGLFGLYVGHSWDSVGVRLAAGLLFPAPQVSAFIEERIAFAPSALVTGGIALFSFWFLIALMWQLVKANIARRAMKPEEKPNQSPEPTAPSGRGSS